MSFLIQRFVGRALALTQIGGDVLRIGRGTRAELRSENPAVALDHAVIDATPAGYTVTDLGSITGTYVNGRPVESAVLAKGDVIEIGDLRIEVQVADAGQPLFIRVTSTAVETRAAAAEPESEAAPAAAAGGVLKAPRIDFRSAFQLSRPYLTRTTITALVLVGTLTLIAEVTLPRNQKAFAPGGVSSAHSRAVNVRGQSIANDCGACHDPWHGVTDTRCQSCHGRMVHARNQTAPPMCAGCHAEHRGATTLAAIPDGRCVGCHGNIAAHTSGPTRLTNVLSFGSRHPDFVFPPNRDTLRLNHRLHLRPSGVFNGDGRREVLTCTSCHQMVETKGKVDPAPIRFDRDCQRCHRLTFDPAFPDAEVPHGGDPSLVYGFVLATYSGNRDIANKPPEEVRRILTQHPAEGGGERAILAAEQVVKVKCAYCHEVLRRNGRLAVTPPASSTRWSSARFSHGPHRAIACESCHAAARDSVNTSDVLMPQRSACVDCHGERRFAGSMRGSSNCVHCHRYHHAGGFNPPAVLASLRGGGVVRSDLEGGPGMLGSILLVFIGLLLIVVMAPVGLALYQRMRPARREQPAATPPPPPPPAPAAKVPPLLPDTVRAITPSAERPATAPAPQPLSAPMKATQETRKEEPQPETPGATQLLQWNGMLRCTSGPMEGKTFIIEDEGLYIGRDPALANVVIDDTRISKRHLRVVPRSGKVWAIDQNSTNGTFLGKAGGERITEVQLKRGDVIVLGDNAAAFVYMT